MTSFLAKEELKLVVVGDVRCGKTNFIEKFLDYYPPFLEIQRDTDDIYLCCIQDRSITIPFSGLKIKFTCNTIRLHNVNDMTIVSDHKFYDELDVIFYCYASDNPVSFRNLEEKWIPLLKSKAQYSFLVANLSTQQNSLVQKQQRPVSPKNARRLKKRFHLRSFVQHTDGYKKLFTILNYFLNHALSRLYRRRFSETEMDTDSKGMENLDEDFHLTENRSRIHQRTFKVSTVLHV
ncbi:hypothetical protein AVEN_10842-1 [Araneus ventricosus]|uniref:Ras-like GTP-binding protein RhoL n=1 Tax=Araneus ventricosus TaxID=182803 RepID=A0A4Y2X0H8_ARAVE|nr:hypothetical protein AVEN_10842-1 [Araneus ventricosus]